MALRIVVNQREITNPVVKLVFVLGAMLVAGLVIAGVIFILLPLMGITVVVSMAFVLVVVTGTMIAAFVLALFAILYAIIRGSFHLSLEQHRRK